MLRLIRSSLTRNVRTALVNSCRITAPQRRHMATGKDIVTGDAARAILLDGINQIVDAVQTTLGPKGQCCARR